MAIIGNPIVSTDFPKDTFSGNGSTTAFTMQIAPASVNSVIVVVSGITQDPSTYTISDTTLTFSAAPPTGTSNISVRHLGVAGIPNTPSAASVVTASIADANVTYAKLSSDLQRSGMKNRIINGAMVISQYNGTSSTTPTSDAYVIDRFRLQVSQASKLTFQQNAGSVTPPVGFVNYGGITTASAYSIGSGDYFNLMQVIEGFNCADLQWGTSNAKTVTVSFWVRSSLTGTFGGALKSYDNARSYPFTYTISSANTWEQKSVTVVGDTTGTWNTGNTGGIIVQLGLGVGSTYSGTSGSWASANYISATGAVSVVGTAGATWYMTGLQLEVGSSATGYEYRQYGTELSLCQRYYEQWNLANGSYQYLSNGFSWSGNGVRTILQFLVTKRANPSSTVSGDLIFANSGKSATLSSGFSFDGAGVNSVLLYNDSSSGWTTGQGCQVSTSTSAKLTFSSEL